MQHKTQNRKKKPQKTRKLESCISDSFALW